MASSEFQNGDFQRDSADQPHSESEPASQPDDSANRELLERALQQTISALGGDDSGEPADLAPLLEVARRHRGRPLTLDPVAIELVQAVLASRLTAVTEVDRMWRNMLRHIATTLLDDPHCSDRLNALWLRLNKMAG